MKTTGRVVWVYTISLSFSPHLSVFSLSPSRSFSLFVLCVQTSLGAALISAGAQLKVLDLSDNAFGPDGVKGIETLLKSSACYTLQELRLNNCGMGIGGGKVRETLRKDLHRVYVCARAV